MLEYIKTDGSESGSSASLKINKGFAQIDTNLTNIETLDSKITGNTSNIAVNTSNIALNTSNISALDVRVQTNTNDIATKIPFIPSFNYSKNSLVVANDTYEEVNRLEVVNLETGLYTVTLAMIFTIDSTTSSAYFRFSTDGGSTWTEIRKETKDVTDKIPITHIFTDDFQGGDKTIIVQARKEVAGDVLDILTQEILYERKL